MTVSFLHPRYAGSACPAVVVFERWTHSAAEYGNCAFQGVECWHFLDGLVDQLDDLIALRFQQPGLSLETQPLEAVRHPTAHNIGSYVRFEQAHCSEKRDYNARWFDERRV